MKKLIFFSLTLAICFEVRAENDPAKQMKAFKTIRSLMGPRTIGVAASEISVNCGGVLDAETGVISYKFGEPLESESCVWVVQPMKKPKTNFKLIYSGFGVNASINIYTPTVTTGEVRQVATLTRASPSILNVAGSIFYIHFTIQGNITETGFILTFEGQTTDSKTDPIHSQYLLTEESGSHRHPLTEDNYTQNEFTSIVLPFISGKSVSLTVSNVAIPIISINNSICTGDILNVYQFDGLQPYSLVRFCSKSVSSVTLSSNSPVLVTFMSVNRVLPGRDGFQLDWNYQDDPAASVPTTIAP